MNLAAEEKIDELFPLAALPAFGFVFARAGLTETRVRGSDFEKRSFVGASAWLSSTARWGCGYVYDGTAAGSPDQRFYASSYGRFNTADSFAASAGPGDPGSWNRYSYTRGDPVNRIDPRGTCDISISGWGFNDFMFPYTSCDASLGSDINPAALTECFAVNTCLANFQAAQGGSGGGVLQTFAGPNNITVTGYSRTGPNETTITNDLNDILNQVLTGPCGTWLTGPDFSASQLISALETGGAGGGPTYGYGVLNNNTTAAFVGNNYANGTPIPGLPVDASITVNTNGAFFNSGFTVGSGNAQYTGGTLQAQIFILVHELAHLVGAANFVPDAGNSTAVSNNNQLVQQNCGKQIAGVH